MVAGDLPHHLGLSIRQVLNEDVEVRPVAARRRIRYAPSVGRESAGIMYGFGVAGEVRDLAVFEQEELRAFVAARVHAEEEPVLGRRGRCVRDALLVEG